MQHLWVYWSGLVIRCIEHAPPVGLLVWTGDEVYRACNTCGSIGLDW